jgi:ubiquinone/menaquinone biosynthesis C-methylase UbiE
MDDSIRSWEADYLARGRLWGGLVQPFPPLPRGSRILELGCGDGRTLSRFEERGWDPVAIDFSRQATWLCRQNPKNPTTEVMTADARALPFKNNSFDAIAATHCIGHMTIGDRTTAAQEIFRVLVPGGILVFRGFSPDDLRYGRGEKIENQTFRRGNGIITHYFSEKETEILFSPLVAVSLGSHRWSMRVRGEDLQRSEIQGLFKKAPEK